MVSPRVAVLFGGTSGEHEVSVASARSVLAAIDRDRFTPVPIGISKSGRWWSSAATERALAELAGAELAALPDSGDGLLADLDGLAALRTVDIVFPLTHGTGGEDGALQGLLEWAGLPYVGAGVAASAVGMDKSMQKALWREAGLPVTDSLTLSRADWRTDPAAVCRQVERALDYPIFVKPANGGSSVGVSKVRSREDLTDAFSEAMRWDRKVVVERTVAGREIECAVLGNDEPQPSPLGEIRPQGEFYSYEAKYVDHSTELIVPADVPAGITKEIQQLAVAAYRAIDCAGLARVDFFLQESGEPLLNEINTLPGFTSISMYPRLWQVAGLSYPDLLSRLIDLGLERHADRTGR